MIAASISRLVLLAQPNNGRKITHSQLVASLVAVSHLPSLEDFVSHVSVDGVATQPLVLLPDVLGELPDPATSVASRMKIVIYELETRRDESGVDVGTDATCIVRLFGKTAHYHLVASFLAVSHLSSLQPPRSFFLKYVTFE